jgi:hypothetical protein
MFSDVVYDSLETILDSLKPNYAYEGVYPRNVVINMLTSMRLAILVSDMGSPVGGLLGGLSMNDLYREAHANAVKDYDDRMKK